MAQTKLTLEEIRSSDPFRAGGDDIHLDLSSYPHLVPLADTSPEDDQFAPVDTRGMGAGSSALKQFLSAPDREAIEGLKDPELLKKYDEQHGSGTTVYASSIPFQISQRGDKWHAKGTTPDGAVHRFTADTRDGLYPKITNAVRQKTVRQLTESEKLQTVRMAQSGDTTGAIAYYLRLAIGEERASRYADPTEMLGDTALAEVFDECSLLTWFAGRPNVQDSEEFSGFLGQYAGRRPLTHSLLDGCWAAFEKEQRMSILPRAVRNAEQPATPHEIQTALEDASDADIENMMTSTKREFVRQVRAGIR
jgi:hypothetical protein